MGTGMMRPNSQFSERGACRVRNGGAAHHEGQCLTVNLGMAQDGPGCQKNVNVTVTKFTMIRRRANLHAWIQSDPVVGTVQI